MKWLILSDSHGVVSNMKQAVIRSAPDGILHLGDCWQDGQRLHQLFPQIHFYQVPGNCDFRPDEPSERVLETEGFRILLCHGHTYGVKQSLLSAGYAARRTEPGSFSLRPHPSSSGGPAGQNSVFESRQYR